MAQCEVCGNRYDKHTQSEGRFFCCVHCAGGQGKPQMRDRVETRPTTM